jgi:hypothetical protein
MADIKESRPRVLLPFLNTVRHGNRSHATCFYKCGNACDAAVPNQTGNPTFADAVQKAFSRRNMLKAAGVSALVARPDRWAPRWRTTARGSAGPPAVEVT